jgi:NADPH:quinone reductase-like Zn-dependent oxidoreductase
MLQNGGLTQLDEGELLQGDVAVRIVNSSINYKHALALTGKAPIIRRFPIVPGVDLAGIVEQSKARQLSAWREGHCEWLENLRGPLGRTF